MLFKGPSEFAASGNGCCWSTANQSGPRKRRCSKHQHSRNSHHDSWTATRKLIAQNRAELRARSRSAAFEVRSCGSLSKDRQQHPDGLERDVEWGSIERVPCVIKLLPTPKNQASFHDFEEYERLVEATRSSLQDYLFVLLGGEAGLRCGEIMALEWTDLDLNKRQLCVARSDWKGHVTVPKGGRLGYVPLTRRLAEALRQTRHLRGARVLCNDEGQPLTQKVVQVMMRRAARKANVKPGVHILRHTFCSHLAMRGAPARAIQELAGHQDLATTQRYMHLSPAALDAAIRLLETGSEFRGEIMEAAGKSATEGRA